MVFKLHIIGIHPYDSFENDVKMYGIQTFRKQSKHQI